MNRRLLKITEHIKPDSIGLVDVGTDHGYIPIYLRENGYNGSLFGTDINEGPIRKAIHNAEQKGFLDSIDFFLCDGLESIRENQQKQIDTIVIAGMGGEVITGILDRAPWIFSPNIRLILQPMTKPEILRYWLVNNGFEIIADDYVEDKRLYQIISASYTGVNPKYKLSEFYIGKGDRSNPDFQRIYEKYREKFRYESNALRNAPNANDGYRKLVEQLLAELEEQ